MPSSVSAGRRSASTSRMNAIHGLAVVGVVQLRVDGAGVEAQQPRPEPVVVAVLEDPQVGRGGDDEPGAIGEAAGPQRGARAAAGRPRVAQERDAVGRGERLAIQAVELRRQRVEHVLLGRP